MPPPSKHQGMGKPTGKGKEKPPSARGKPQHDGHPEPMMPRSPAYKRRKAQGGKGENGVAKEKAHGKGGGPPPPGGKGKAPSGLDGKSTGGKAVEAAAADGTWEGGTLRESGEAKSSQEELQRRRASPSLTIQIPHMH